MARPTCPIASASAIWCQSAVGLSRLAFDPPDLAGDRPGVADGFDKMHPVADLQPVEIPLDQAVAVEIELTALMGQDEAVILLGVELRHLAGKEGIVLFDLAALLALVIDEAPLGGLEGIAQRNAEIRIGEFLAGAMRLPGDHELVARHAQVDVHIIEIAGVMAAMQLLDRDPAAGQV